MCDVRVGLVGGGAPEFPAIREGPIAGFGLVGACVAAGAVAGMSGAETGVTGDVFEFHPEKISSSMFFGVGFGCGWAGAGVAEGAGAGRAIIPTRFKSEKL